MPAYCERQVNPKASLDKRSIRTKFSGKARVLVGCPTGKWKARKKRCSVGMRAYKVLAPAKGRCPIRTKRIIKSR